jgi:A/G-specific adenine glycosylase
MDPYNILISEIMLQQTRVETVIPKYQEFLKAIPDISHLAQSSLEEILSLWQGLGYNRRAIALHRLAHQVMVEYRGRIPREKDALVRFPGIGEATASAILVYAWNEPVIFIETNIRRVYLHFFFPSLPKVKDTDLQSIVHRTLDREDPRKWYNALMDYGSWLQSRAIHAHRKSTAYKKQAPFSGSRRQLRGRILSHLIRVGESMEGTLYTEFSEDQERVNEVLMELVEEGFLLRDSGRVRIA